MCMQFKAIVPVVLLVICVGFIFVDYYTDPLLDAPEGYYGAPAISTNYPDLSMKIQQVVEDGSRIYILFDSSKRIVQVYDLGGEYQCTLFFYSHYDNGAFAVATEENTLYVEDERENVYVFSNGVFERFYKEDEVTQYLANIEFDWRYSSKFYEIRNGSVWRDSPNGKTCIIQKKYSQSQIVGGILVATLAVVVLVKKIRRVQDGGRFRTGDGSLS